MFSRHFFQNSSVHVFNLLANTGNSKFRRFFWIVVSMLTFSFCTYQIVNDIDNLKSESVITVKRPMKQEEMVDLFVTICYKHWVLWIDPIAMKNYNLTHMELMSLLTPFNNKFRSDTSCHFGKFSNETSCIGQEATSALNKIGLGNRSWTEPNILDEIVAKLIGFVIFDLYYVDDAGVLRKREHITKQIFDIKHSTLMLCRQAKIIFYCMVETDQIIFYY